MTVPEALSKIFKKELEILMEREEKEKTFLNAEYFFNNEGRAAAGLSQAMEQVTKKAAIMICEHRAKHHNEDVSKELIELKSSLKLEYAELEVSEWWNA